MKKVIITLGLLAVFTIIALAGEIVTLPEYLVLTNPTTNQIDKMSVTFYYGSPPYAIIAYKPVDTEGRFGLAIKKRVYDVIDNPETAVENCTDVAVPWAGCTGVGTGGEFLDGVSRPWDETDTSFTDLVAGYGATLKTRVDAIIYSDVQDRYETQGTP